jgi:hypothetical protein
VSERRSVQQRARARHGRRDDGRRGFAALI